MHLSTASWLIFKPGRNITFTGNKASNGGNSIFSSGTKLTWSGLCPKVATPWLVPCTTHLLGRASTAPHWAVLNMCYSLHLMRILVCMTAPSSAPCRSLATTPAAPATVCLASAQSQVAAHKMPLIGHSATRGRGRVRAGGRASSLWPACCN